jgi:hypothetical protein
VPDANLIVFVFVPECIFMLVLLLLLVVVIVVIFVVVVTVLPILFHQILQDRVQPILLGLIHVSQVALVRVLRFAQSEIREQEIIAWPLNLIVSVIVAKSRGKDMRCFWSVVDVSRVFHVDIVVELGKCPVQLVIKGEGAPLWVVIDLVRGWLRVAQVRWGGVGPFWLSRLRLEGRFWGGEVEVVLGLELVVCLGALEEQNLANEVGMEDLLPHIELRVWLELVAGKIEQVLGKVRHLCRCAVDDLVFFW